MNIPELTLLSEEQVFDKEKKLSVIKKYGTSSISTDLCVFTGAVAELVPSTFGKADSLGDSLAKTYGLVAKYDWTRRIMPFTIPRVRYAVNFVDEDEIEMGAGGFVTGYNIAIRPILQSDEIFDLVYPNRYVGEDGVEEVEFGEYPQQAVWEVERQDELFDNLDEGALKKTGKIYTFDSRTASERRHDFFQVTSYPEYEYLSKKYICIRITPNRPLLFTGNQDPLQFGKKPDYSWVEVLPVKWLIDKETKTLISKYSLVSGVGFCDLDTIQGSSINFEDTTMYEYLNKYMAKDLFSNVSLNYRKQDESKMNPYGFNLEQVSEEEIIKGAIESDVPVFLHGKSSDGKSARIKQIDPTCEIIYLRNATPESLNGKTVYNNETGEMIDVPPTWLKSLKEKCEKEPDRKHVVFLDEISNALPSIQGMAFNIVLDREVNGIWKLPDNARIVAAGNEMEDSLAANQIAEPLFNRFAHVYIKTTTESWLKWASENNIHPAIYSYIAYKNGEVLRSEYNGETPNADPRKWEMASKMLYATGSPEMIRALVGEDITREFVQFCNQQVITLDDVINDNYTDSEVQALNTAEKYATTMALTQASKEDFEKVRNFVSKSGSEFRAIFDALWTHGDEDKLEILAETKLEESQGIRK